jgi:hypothetical protein
MRDDEEFAKEAFGRFLSRAGGASAQWQDGPDPPDYFLTWGASRFAVEVTQVMEQLDLGAKPLPYRGMARALKSFTERLQAKAKEAGVLHGTYMLDLSPIPNLASHEAILTDQILRFLASPPAPGHASWTPLLQGVDGPIVQIMKLSDAGAVICEIVGGSGAKWGRQIVEESSGLILGALGVKADRLKEVPGAHILLLIDEYHYAPGEYWQAVVAAAGVLQSRFHTIARIHGEYECQVLHSIEPTWRAAA